MWSRSRQQRAQDGAISLQTVLSACLGSTYTNKRYVRGLAPLIVDNRDARAAVDKTLTHKGILSLPFVRGIP